MSQSPKVAIIGGGITGLTAAYTLERETDFDVTLFESSQALGGKVKTLHSDGFTIEEGPDSVFAGKPAALELISELKLEDEVVEPQAKGFYLLLGTHLYAVPAGLASLGGVSPIAIEQADFLTQEAKERALAEPSVPPEISSDESIAHFFSRRFGDEFSRFVAEPILAGTHAGNPSKLSMRALYPHYLDREAEHGALASTNQSGSRPNGPTFLSFKDGMITLVEALERALSRTRIKRHAGSVQFAVEENSVAVWSEEHPSKDKFSHVLIATPANSAAELLGRDFPESADLMRQIGFASSAIVTVAYDANSLPGELCGTGFLTPYDEEELLTGCTWSSSKWPNRAPEDKVLIRFFYGGDGRPELPSDSEELIKTATENAEEILRIEAKPLLAKVSRWERALPQYALGHTKLVDRIEDSLDGSRFSVAGSSYRGVGIPDCIRQGRDVARKIAKELA